MTTTHDPAVRTVAISAESWRRLRRLNIAAAALHAVQAAAMLALSTAVSLPVTALFASGPPGTAPDGAALDTLADVRLGPAVATFLLLSAVFHLLVSIGPGGPRYRAELSRHRNRFRWVEYSLSASVMIVLIALITGITDIAALIPGAKLKGRGMMQGIDVGTGELAELICTTCFANGLIVETSGAHHQVVKILAALTIPVPMLRRGLEIIELAVKEATRTRHPRASAA